MKNIEAVSLGTLRERERERELYFSEINIDNKINRNNKKIVIKA